MKPKPVAFWRGHIEKGRRLEWAVWEIFFGFLFGGLWTGLSWVAAGVLWCITIVGIPIGKQCFKFAKLAFFPFGKEVEYGGSAVSVVCNTFLVDF